MFRDYWRGNDTPKNSSVWRRLSRPDFSHIRDGLGSMGHQWGTFNIQSSQRQEDSRVHVRDRVPRLTLASDNSNSAADIDESSIRAGIINQEATYVRPLPGPTRTRRVSGYWPNAVLRLHSFEWSRTHPRIVERYVQCRGKFPVYAYLRSPRVSALSLGKRTNPRRSARRFSRAGSSCPVWSGLVAERDSVVGAPR